MRTLLFPLLLALPLTAAAHQHISIGTATAAAMQSYYNDTPERCNTAPAFVCSGILLRATQPSPAYKTWHHSPNSREKGGVSFSYLRADTPMDRLAASGSSGFTLTPRSYSPAASLPYQVLCAFPTDGDTWTRDTFGCGNNSQTASVEKFCHQQGVLTAEQWIARYNATSGPADKRYFAQCAFDVRPAGREKATDSFHQSLRVMKLMPNRPFPWNEVVLEAWDEKRASELPIQSFFHIKGHNGLHNAQFEQRDWHASTGKFVPIIELSLPTSNRPARFTYHQAEQAVPLPR